MGSEFTMFTVSEPTSSKIPLAHVKYSKPRQTSGTEQAIELSCANTEKDGKLTYVCQMPS